MLMKRGDKMPEVPEYWVDTFMMRMSSFGMSVAFIKTSSPLTDMENENVDTNKPNDIVGFIEQVEGRKVATEAQCITRMSLAGAKALVIILRYHLRNYERSQGGPILVPKDLLEKNEVTLTDW